MCGYVSVNMKTGKGMNDRVNCLNYINEFVKTSDKKKNLLGDINAKVRMKALME